MGMDIVAIIKNKLTINQIFKLPQAIENDWVEILEFYNENFIAPWTTLKYEKIIDLSTIWNKGRLNEDKVDQEYIIKALERKDEFDLDITCELIELKFSKNTILISPILHHKYANFENFETRNFILKLIRLVCKKLDANEIIYCSDSGVSTAYLDELRLVGCSYEEIKRTGIELFGIIPPKLSEAVFNYFFIDDFNLDLNDYNTDSFCFNRCNEEYFLEKKFGQNIIIKRGNYFP